MQTYDVLTIGRSCVDFIIVVDEFPHENSKMSPDSRLMEAGVRENGDVRSICTFEYKTCHIMAGKRPIFALSSFAAFIEKHKNNPALFFP
jgi:hypothetical protein